MGIFQKKALSRFSEALSRYKDADDDTMRYSIDKKRIALSNATVYTVFLIHNNDTGGTSWPMHWHYLLF